MKSTDDVVMALERIEGAIREEGNATRRHLTRLLTEEKKEEQQPPTEAEQAAIAAAGLAP